MSVGRVSVTEAATGAGSGSAVTEVGRKPPRLARRGRQRQGRARKRHSLLLNVLMTVMLLYALNLSFGGQQYNYSATIAIVMGLLTAVIAYAVQLRGARRGT